MDIREEIRLEGKLEGMQKGIQQGMQKGMQQGRKDRDREVILNMLKKNAELSFISEVTGLSPEEIKKLQNGGS